MSFVLIGFSGVGKSSLLSVFQKKEIKILDSDLLLEEKYSLPCSKIFKLLKEKKFREEESSILENVSKSAFLGVLATGGGVVEKEENQNFLKKIGKIIFLKEKKEILFERILKKKSFFYQNMKLKDLEKLFFKREKIYEKWATQIVLVTNKSLEAIAEEIINGK